MKKNVINLFVSMIAGVIMLSSCGNTSGSIALTSLNADKVYDPNEGECMEIKMDYYATGVTGDFISVVYFQKDGEPIIDDVNDKYNLDSHIGAAVGIAGSMTVTNNPEEGTLSLRFPFKELHVQEGTPNLSFVVAITRCVPDGNVTENDVLFQSEPIPFSY